MTVYKKNRENLLFRMLLHDFKLYIRNEKWHNANPLKQAR